MPIWKHQLLNQHSDLFYVDFLAALIAVVRLVRFVKFEEFGLKLPVFEFCFCSRSSVTLVSPKLAVY